MVLIFFNYVLSNINIYLLIYIFKKKFIDLFFKLFNFIIKNLKIKYDNNLLFKKFNKIFNIYKIVILLILKYVKERIYRIFILISIRENFKSISKFIKKKIRYRNIYYFIISI